MFCLVNFTASTRQMMTVQYPICTVLYENMLCAQNYQKFTHIYSTDVSYICTVNKNNVC